MSVRLVEVGDVSSATEDYYQTVRERLNEAGCGGTLLVTDPEALQLIGEQHELRAKDQTANTEASADNS